MNATITKFNSHISESNKILMCPDSFCVFCLLENNTDHTITHICAEVDCE